MADTELQQLVKIGQSGGRNPIQETRYQQLLKEQGGGTPSFNDPNLILQQQATNQANLIAKQKADQGAFLGRYTTDMEAARTGISNELGLPQLRQNTQAAGQYARDASRVMQDLPQALTATGRAASVNQNRLTRAIAQKSGEYQPTLETARRSFEDTNAAQTFGETQYTQRLQEASQPYQLEASMLSESLGREFSGYTTQMQNELNVTLQKMANGQALTMAELNRANELADAETNFEKQKELLKFEAELKPKEQSKLMTLGQGQTVYDPITGRAMYTAPYKTGADASAGTVDFSTLWEEFNKQ